MLVFNIYTELHMVDFGRSVNQPDHSRSIECAFTDSLSVVQLNLDSIKYTIFLSAKPAEWQYPEVWIQIVDPKTSLMMQKNEVVNHTGLAHEPVLEKPGSRYMHQFQNYFVLNYNRNISLDDLNNEMNKISEKIYEPELRWIKSEHKARGKIFEQEKLNTVVPLIHLLRQKGIIIIEVQTTC